MQGWNLVASLIVTINQIIKLMMWWIMQLGMNRSSDFCWTCLSVYALAFLVLQLAMAFVPTVFRLKTQNCFIPCFNKAMSLAFAPSFVTPLAPSTLATGSSHGSFAAKSAEARGRVDDLERCQWPMNPHSGKNLQYRVVVVFVYIFCLNDVWGLWKWGSIEFSFVLSFWGDGWWT